MLIVGLFLTFPAAQRALEAAASPLAARAAQIMCVVALLIFIWPAVKSLLSGVRGG